MIIDGVQVLGSNYFSPDECKAYVQFVKLREPDVVKIHLSPAEHDFVQIDWVAQHTGFERIRRITGYLVGTIDRWNDAKIAEERDRLKHEV